MRVQSVRIDSARECASAHSHRRGFRGVEQTIVASLFGFLARQGEPFPETRRFPLTLLRLLKHLPLVAHRLRQRLTELREARQRFFLRQRTSSCEDGSPRRSPTSTSNAKSLTCRKTQYIGW